MNTAQSLFGISQLEAAKKIESSKVNYFDNGYVIELSNGELITIKELCDFWIEGHEKINKAKEIIKNVEKITKETCCKQQSADEKEVESKSRVEGTETENKRKTKRGPNNKKALDKKLQSSSSESK